MNTTDVANTTRAGSWRKQPQGYRAFYPAPLPPEPPLQIDDELQALLSRADRCLGRLDGSIQTLPNPDMLVFMYVRKEAVHSSRIEGTLSSLNDVLEAEARILNPNRPRDVGEVLNYAAAINYALERLQTLPVSVRLIRELHARLLKGVRGEESRPGELRTVQNWVGPAGAGPVEAAFVPPPADEVPEALGQLERFLHDDQPMPLLIRIGLAHAQFETIHPFLDGNGRVGRLLIMFLLCERAVLHKPALYISHYLRAHRQRYFDLLQAVRTQGDWEGWLKFFVEAVIESTEQAVATARSVVELRERDRMRIVEGFGRVAGNALKVVEQLYQRPLITVKEVQELTGVSYPSANQLVVRFVESGLLSEITRRTRNRVFRYGEYIELF